LGTRVDDPVLECEKEIDRDRDRGRVERSEKDGVKLGLFEPCNNVSVGSVGDVWEI
jgi:hypothetical protein